MIWSYGIIGRKGSIMGQDLSTWFEEELLPEAFRRLDEVFPEFGWKTDGASGWKATKDSGLGVRPDRVVCHRPFGFFVHGEGNRTWLAYLNGGTFPSGEAWLSAVRELAKRVGMSLPTRDLAPEARVRMEGRKRTSSLVEEIVQLCHRLLLESPDAQEARAYLEGRGLARDRWEMWELGYMPKDTSPIVQSLEKNGWKWEDAKSMLLDAGILAQKDETRHLYPHLYGRVIAPWRDPSGRILGFWGRKLTDEKPKYMYTRGEWRTLPYLLDRGGHGDRLILVEGVLDAIQCREHGFPAVALGGVGLDAYLPSLGKASPKGVILVLDADEAGEKAAGSAIAKLLGLGVSAFLVSLPKGEMGAKTDPDSFLRHNGAEAFRRLLSEAPHALRWQARNILDRHRGSGWTDQKTEAAIREALGFAGQVAPSLHPSLRPLFWDEIAQEIPLSVDVMHEAAQAIHEEKERDRRERDTRAKVRSAAKRLEALLEEDRPDDAHRVLLEEANALQSQAFNAPRVSPRPALDEIDAHRQYLNGLRGRNRVGIAQTSLPELDSSLMGLRGLMLLAGPPGTGKTSLAVQLGLGALKYEEDTVVVLLSLEQTRFEHLSRILAHLSNLEWETVTMGSPECRNGRDRQAGVFFSPSHLASLQKGENLLKELGSRLLILDDENFPAPTSEKILREIEALKEKSGASKALVVVDYLQLWPVPLEQAKALRTDLDRDKWQIGQLKALRNRLGAEDAVIAISEAKKDAWDGSLGLDSVMGSARGTYTPDAVLVIQPLSDEGHGGDKKDQEQGRQKREMLADGGKALMRLRIVKGRDGVQRRSFELVFFHRQTRFEETAFAKHLQ